MSFFVFFCYLFICKPYRIDYLGWKRANFLQSFTFNYVVSVVGGGFLFLLVLGMGYVILLWHSPGIPYNFFILLNN